MKSSETVVTEAFIVTSTTTSHKSSTPSEAASTETKASVHIWAGSAAISRPTKTSVWERSSPEACSSSRRTSEISSTSRRSSSHSTPASATSKAGLPAVATVLVSEESVKVSRVVVVVVTLDLSPGHHVEYEVEGGHQTLQTAADLDTAVAGLWGAV